MSATATAAVPGLIPGRIWVKWAVQRTKSYNRNDEDAMVVVIQLYHLLLSPGALWWQIKDPINPCISLGVPFTQAPAMHWHIRLGLAIYKYNLRRSEINYSLSRATFSLS